MKVSLVWVWLFLVAVLLPGSASATTRNFKGQYIYPAPTDEKHRARWDLQELRWIEDDADTTKVKLEFTLPLLVTGKRIEVSMNGITNARNPFVWLGSSAGDAGCLVKNDSLNCIIQLKSPLNEALGYTRQEVWDTLRDRFPLEPREAEARLYVADRFSNDSGGVIVADRDWNIDLLPLLGPRNGDPEIIPYRPTPPYVPRRNPPTTYPVPDRRPDPP